MLGCPQECALKENFGAFLVEKDADVALTCIASMRKALDIYSYCDVTSGGKPLLSAKIRLLDGGLDENIKFVSKLQTAGVDYVTVHCRHRKDKHSGKANWELGDKIVTSSELPIILNGGISDRVQALSVLKQTKCHAVMAATGYLQNHRHFETPTERTASLSTPQHLALDYLEFAKQYPPPSYLYVQKHLRWIFRGVLQPNNDPSFLPKDYSDWRVKLWSFLVRPYLRHVEQFRLFVALYVKLSGGNENGLVPKSISHLVETVSFGSVKKAGNKKRKR